MTAKLCPHVQDLSKCRWLGTKVVTPGDWLKVMGPGAGIGQRFPGKRIVGRWYVKDESQYIERGAQGADDYYSLLAPHYEETCQGVAVVESVNEPGCQTLAQIEQLGDFLTRWIRLMHGHGYTVAVPAFSVGNPPEWVVPALDSVWAITDYISMHTYGTRRIDEEWRGYTSLRYCQFTEHLAEPRPMLLTECGIDRGGDGYRKKPGNTPWPQYLEQLCWYEAELQKDPFVEAAFVFTSGATRTWASFDCGEGEWNDLAKRLR